MDGCNWYPACGCFKTHRPAALVGFIPAHSGPMKTSNNCSIRPRLLVELPDSEDADFFKHHHIYSRRVFWVPFVEQQAKEVDLTLRRCSTGSRRCMVASRSGVRYLISTMPSGSSTPPEAAGSAYISTCTHPCTVSLSVTLSALGGHA